MTVGAPDEVDVVLARHDVGRAEILWEVRNLMNRVEKLEGEIGRLSPRELAAFREWFAEFDADAWDRRFTADVGSGKLDRLAECALGDRAAGRSSKL
jgi:hypothetical protein